jgi:hypothetical protein
MVSRPFEQAHMIDRRCGHDLQLSVCDRQCCTAAQAGVVMMEKDAVSLRGKTSVRRLHQLVLPVAVLLLLNLARPVLAAGPQDELRESLNTMTATLKDPSLQSADKRAERQQRVRQIIRDTFDFEEMAKLAHASSETLLQMLKSKVERESSERATRMRATLAGQGRPSTAGRRMPCMQGEAPTSASRYTSTS